MPLNPNGVLNVLILPSSVCNLSLLYVDLVSTCLPLQLAQVSNLQFGTMEDKPKQNVSMLSVCYLGEIFRQIH